MGQSSRVAEVELKHYIDGIEANANCTLDDLYKHRMYTTFDIGFTQGLTEYAKMVRGFSIWKLIKWRLSNSIIFAKGLLGND